jgi:hypothetical protein
MADDRYEKGFIVRWLGAVSEWFKRKWLMSWFAHIWPSLNQSAVAIELYVLCCFAITLAVSVAVCWLNDCAAARWPLAVPIYVLVGLRVPEILIRAADVDVKKVICLVRTLVLAVINYVELMLLFGLVYALNCQLLHGAGQPATAFYFSVITQLTIGYGDVYATGWLRIIAVVQGLIGALFVIVVLGRAVSAPMNAPDDRYK